MSAQPIETRMSHLEGAYDQLGQRINGMEAQRNSLDVKVDGVRDVLSDKIDGVRDALNDKIDGVRDALNDKIDGVREALGDKIDGVRDALNDKIDGLQWRMMALILGTWITTILTVLFHRG